MPEMKTALITGAASGIGRATVERFFADSKYRPICAVDKDPAINRIFPRETFPGVIPWEIDLSVDQQIENVIKAAFNLSPDRLDVMVNAAGIMVEGDPVEFSSKDGNWHPEPSGMRKINLIAIVRGMVKASLLMKAHGGGTIINITSAKHFYPDLYHLEYMQDKAMLSRLTKTLARSYSEEDQIRLVDIQPGNTKTNIDRGNWVSGNNQTEIETVSSVNNWWRNHFGNDPKKVANVIYDIAEGRKKGSPVYVGLDTQIGRALYLVTSPTIFFRSDMLFFFGSTLFYKALTLGNMLRRRFSSKTTDIQS